MLRTFLTSYFWPNCYRKKSGNPARAVVKIRAVVRLAYGTMGRAVKLSGRYDQTRLCCSNSAAFRIGLVTALAQNGRSIGWIGRQAFGILFELAGELWRHHGGGDAPPGSRGMPARCSEDGPGRRDSVQRGHGKGKNGAERHSFTTALWPQSVEH